MILHMKKKLGSSRALSTTEVFCILCFAVILALGLILGVSYYRRQMRIGNDNHLVLNAERTATMDLVGSTCIVRNCDGKTSCTHKTGSYNIGYFDHPTNTIVGALPKGYNEYKIMDIGDKTYYGPVNTMVIRVMYDGSMMILDWVKGRE